MPGDHDAYDRDDAATIEKERQERDEKRRREEEKRRPEEERRRREDRQRRDAEYLKPETRRKWIDKIKQDGAKSPIPTLSTKPGVFPKMWQERLKVDEKGNPHPTHPVVNPGLKETGEETWQGGKMYKADVGSDSFVHFTPRSRAQQIMDSGKLLANPPHKKFGIEGVQAISLGYGKSVPGTQTQHIETDKDDPLVAVVFRTKTVPQHGYVEETIWDNDVGLHDARIVESGEALGMLENAPSRIDGDDMVTYGRSRKTATEKNMMTTKKARRIASAWLRRILLAKYSPEFHRSVFNQKFRHPETGNQVIFYSLPDEEKERLHEQWAGRKQLPQAQIRRKDFMRVREEARDRDRGIDPAAEQAAAKADRKEMVRAIMTLKKRKVPARILDKERKNLIREMESRRLQRKKERERASKEPQQAQAEALTPLS